MKKITFTFLFALASVFAFSQSKFQAGVYAEGGLFFPKPSHSGQNIYNNLTTGVGFYGSYDVFKKLSVSLGAGYRYKLNDESSRYYHTLGDYGYGGYGGYGEYGSAYEYNYDSGVEATKNTYKQHHLVVPLKLRYLLSKKLFIEAGISSAWILNYGKVSFDQLSDAPDAPYHASVNEKQEFDWNVGFGYQLNPRLSLALNYTQGFQEQGMSYIKNMEDHYGQIYKNRMLMLNVSYDIFNGK